MDDAINAAIERLNFVTRDKEFLRYYHMRRMAMSDQTTIINTAIEEGLEKGLKKGLKKGRKEGREEGHAEKALEIAHKMKEMGFSPEQIQAATGLPSEKQL